MFGLTPIAVLAVTFSVVHSQWLPPNVPSWVARQYERRKSNSAAAALSRDFSDANYNGTVYVCDFVSDTTGRTDVGSQIQRVLELSWARAELANRTLDNSTIPQGFSEPDLGGLVFDFCGAHYLVGQPLHFPKGGGGNVVLTNGAIHADPSTFPADSFVVQVDGLPIDSAHDIRYRYLTFYDMEIDGAHAAAGCLLLIAVEEIRVFQVLFTGYRYRGLWTRGQNNEVFITQSWFKEFSDRSLCHDEEAKTGAAIWFDGNDHSIDDVVVFCTRHGVTVNGSATVIRNLHVYTETPSEYPLGGIWVSSGCAGPVPTDGPNWGNGTIVPGGVQVKGVRIQNCYMDGCPIVIDQPAYDLVTGSLFLLGRGVASPGMGGVVLVPHGPNTELTGLQVTGNVAFGHVYDDFPFVYPWESGDSESGRFFVDAGKVIDTVVADNIVQPEYQGMLVTPSTTRLKIRRTVKAGDITAANNTIVLDLTDTLRNSTLLLRGAAHVHYTLQFSNRSDLFIQHALEEVLDAPMGSAGAVVKIALQRSPQGDVTVDLQLDQSTQPVGRLAQAEVSQQNGGVVQHIQRLRGNYCFL